MKIVWVFLLLCSGMAFGAPVADAKGFAWYCGPIADAAPGEIYQWKDARVENRNWCMGYLDGFWDALRTGYETGNSPSLGRFIKFYSFCFVGQQHAFDNQADIKIIVNYIRRHPEYERRRVSQVVIWAFLEAYPCPKDSAAGICRLAQKVSSPGSCKRLGQLAAAGKIHRSLRSQARAH
jgi:hypothetical protein